MHLPHSGLLRKALLGSAFCFWALVSVNAFAQAGNCGVERRDLLSAVTAVLDGDTFVLADGRHVRFIGINTPELAHDDRPAEPLADGARAALARRLAGAGNRVVLQFGAERHDHYGRLLAHPFLPDGTNLSAGLLENGWGVAIAIPPNLAFQACYRAAEAQARDAARGVWGAAYYAPRNASVLGKGSTGFRRVQGRLERVGWSKKAMWLQIGRLGVRIDKRYLPYFHNRDFRALRGRDMVVRGWVTSYRRRLHMNLKHPNDLELLPAVGSAE